MNSSDFWTLDTTGVDGEIRSFSVLDGCFWVASIHFHLQTISFIANPQLLVSSEQGKTGEKSTLLTKIQCCQLGSYFNPLWPRPRSLLVEISALLFKWDWTTLALLPRQNLASSWDHCGWGEEIQWSKIAETKDWDIALTFFPTAPPKDRLIPARGDLNIRLKREEKMLGVSFFWFIYARYLNTGNKRKIAAIWNANAALLGRTWTKCSKL